MPLWFGRRRNSIVPTKRVHGSGHGETSVGGGHAWTPAFAGGDVGMIEAKKKGGRQSTRPSFQSLNATAASTTIPSPEHGSSRRYLLSSLGSFTSTVGTWTVSFLVPTSTSGP